ncbi:2950_t:CDS:2, partial [Gigaspora rosea]
YQMNTSQSFSYIQLLAQFKISDLIYKNTRHNINLRNTNNKRSNNKTTSFNFVNVISQVQKGTSSVKTAYKGKSSSTNNFASTLQNTSQLIPSRATHVEDEEDAASISDDDPTELVEVRIQEVTPEIKEKHGKNLRSSKK